MTCKCDLRTKLVGDGCQYCNPAYAEWVTKPEEETGWQGTTGFPDREELGDDWT